MWGVIRYGHRKVYDATARSMALEAGSALHEVFAAVRLWQLAHIQQLPEHCDVRGEHLFGVERWHRCFDTCYDDDHRTSLQELAFRIMRTGDFYDDPKDNIRTIANLEVSIIRYIDENLKLMPHWYVYVEDENDPEKLVGVELPFDMILEFSDGKLIRFCGTIDGLMKHVKSQGIYPFDNKSAVRLDQGWREAFRMSHQLTGYCTAVPLLLNRTEPITRFRISGLKANQTGHVDDYVFFQETREPFEVFFKRWGHWVYTTVTDVYETYHDDWLNAPQFTHSCNRYFRPCALLTFCTEDQTGMKAQFEVMAEASLSPSEENILRGTE